MRHDHQLGIDTFVAEAMRLSPKITHTQALKLLQSCKSCPRLVVIAVLSADRAGSCSLLPINTTSGLGPIPLTFCPHTGKINRNLSAGVLLTAGNPGLAIFSPDA